MKTFIAVLTLTVSAVAAEQPPKVPSEKEAAYFKELAQYQGISAELQAARANVERGQRLLDEQRPKVMAAKDEMGKSCGKGFSLDDKAFAKGDNVCVAAPVAAPATPPAPEHK